MKNILFFALLILIMSCGNSKIIKSDFDKLAPEELFQRWKLDYGTLNGEKVNGYPPSPENDYQFNTDGTYILYSNKGTDMTGAWEYNDIEKRVYTRRSDGEINGVIKDITKDSFTLLPPKKDVENSPLETLTFYYISKTD